ncbi:zinc finger protein 414 isoform X2 [Lepisosteus oculatus]|uniref:zinc finger protein 414 isoform X2 n=1 Tax=Lepisosteus oculatus TaxID=7918 RepID=UPI003720A828
MTASPAKAVTRPLPVGPAHHELRPSLGSDMSEPPLGQLAPPGATEGKTVPCSFFGCKQVFSDMQKLMSHTRSHYIPTQSLEGKQFHCSTLGCTGTFPSMQKLMDHTRHHYKPNRYFLCESCRSRLRTHHAFFKHLHICQKAAKSRAPPKPEKAEPAAPAACDRVTGIDDDDDEDDDEEEGPPALAPGPAASPSPSSSAPAPELYGLPGFQASLTRLPLAASSSGLFQLPAPFGVPAQAPAEPGPRAFLSYAPPGSLALPQAAVHQRLRVLGPSAPGLPGSNAVWKKNQGQSFNSRIVWEHTRGRYSCLQCQHSTPSRQEMTVHIEEQHRSPSSRAHGPLDFGVGLAAFRSELSPEMESSLVSQL